MSFLHFFAQCTLFNVVVAGKNNGVDFYARTGIENEVKTYCIGCLFVGITFDINAGIEVSFFNEVLLQLIDEGGLGVFGQDSSFLQILGDYPVQVFVAAFFDAGECVACVTWQLFYPDFKKNLVAHGAFLIDLNVGEQFQVPERLDGF